MQVRDQLPPGQHFRFVLHLRGSAPPGLRRERDASALAVRHSPPSAARAAAVGQRSARRRGRARVQVQHYIRVYSQGNLEFPLCMLITVIYLRTIIHRTIKSELYTRTYIYEYTARAPQTRSH